MKKTFKILGVIVSVLVALLFGGMVFIGMFNFDIYRATSYFAKETFDAWAALIVAGTMSILLVAFPVNWLISKAIDGKLL